MGERPVPRITTRGRRRGAILAQLVLILTALVGLMAVVLDGGILLAERRHAQATADAAALAAAADLYKNYRTNNGVDTSGKAATSATTTANENGYTSSNSTITVNIPPTSGNFVGKAGYAEVIVQFNQSRYFSALWGTATLPVKARAVARGILVAGPTESDSNAGILVTNTDTSKNSVTMTGGGNSGGIVLSGSRAFSVNSAGATGNNNGVFNLNGNPAITAPNFLLVSSQSNSGLGSNPGQWLSGPGNTTPSISYNQSPIAIPSRLSSLSAPSTAGLTTQSAGGTTLNPGVYNGGISTNSDVTLNPGIYYLNGGGLTIGGGATVDGSSGVLIYITGISGSQKAIDQDGNASLILNPIGTGTYRGISIFVDPSLSNPPVKIGGTATTNIYGTVYAPTAALSLSGTPNGGFGSQVIVSTLQFNGNATANAGTGPVAGQSTGYQLVE
jgi:Flp pilus assembly protein TadG